MECVRQFVPSPIHRFLDCSRGPGQFQRPRQGQLGGDLREVFQRQVPHVGVEAPLLRAAVKEREDLANRKRH